MNCLISRLRERLAYDSRSIPTLGEPGLKCRGGLVSAMRLKKVRSDRIGKKKSGNRENSSVRDCCVTSCGPRFSPRKTHQKNSASNSVKKKKNLIPFLGLTTPEAKNR